MKQLIDNALASSYNYEEYKSLIKELVATNKTTGPVQSNSLIDYTKLNAARIKRWDKTYNPSLKMQQVLNAIQQKETWLVLTEAWCGDAAHNVPILAKIASYNPSINFRLALRDENLEVMDMHLTNGGRSIPKLIRLNVDGQSIGSWGPRPQILQDSIVNGKEKSIYAKR
jgi:hypothetical protein